MNNKGVSLIALTLTLLFMIILIAICLEPNEEIKKQTCEFGNHHYVCAKCGKELNEK